jgi:hypothetical protein
MNTVRLILLALFLTGFVATITVARQFRQRRYRLETDIVKGGIIRLEIAWSTRRAQAIIEAWRAEGVLDNVRPNIALDTRFFIPSYTLTLLTGCLWSAGALAGWGASLGAPLAAVQLLAGVLDYIENAALLRVVDALGHQNAARNPAPWPAVAALCAWPKFAGVIAGTLYIIAGIIASVIG